VGVKIYGQGFLFSNDSSDGDVTPIADMQRLLSSDTKNSSVIKSYIGGEEVNDSPTHANDRFVINFGEMTESEARSWPDVMKIVESKVRPGRIALSTQDGADRLKRLWWQYARPAKELYIAIAALDRVLVCSQTSTYLCFAFLPSTWVYGQKAVVIAFESWGAFALLQSYTHTEWADFTGSSLGDAPVYTSSKCFETFPFPGGWETDAALEAAGQAYYEFRAELMVANNEGLTKTYNRFHDPEESDPGIHRLRELHAAMDHAVLTAYGCSDLVESGRTTCDFFPDYYDEPEEEGGAPIPQSIRYRWPDATRDEVLARLLKLNAERAAEEVRQGLHSPAAQKAVKKVTAKKVARKAPKAADGSPSEPAPRPDSARPAQQSLQFAPEDLALFQKPAARTRSPMPPEDQQLLP
jgi:hypothetical protein